MMIELTRCVDGVVFATNVNQQLVKQGNWLLLAVEEMHRTGPPITNGSQIEMGWSVLTCRKRSDGVYNICEPDFNCNTKHVVDTTNVTLTILAKQNDIHDMINVKRTHVRYDQRLIIDPSIREADDIYMLRNTPSISSTSGWYIGNYITPSSKNVETIYVHELLNIVPAALAVISLPLKYYVVICGGNIVSILDDRENELLINK